ncbi:MAG: 16S rRNA (cytosine(1402)-N(4))-methyltransferase RsmH [Patescibacteria group bacterium]
MKELTDTIHTPVLLHEVLEVCAPQAGACVIDATANGGGYTFALWERVAPSGCVIAIDKDRDLVTALERRARAEHARIVPICGSYRDLAAIAHAHACGPVRGIVFDLGYSSHHIERSGRGFSFQKDEPLLMRYETNSDLGDGLTAYDVVNQSSEYELADIIWRFGEERRSRAIARAVCAARKKQPIRTTGELAAVVRSAYPARHMRIHPATRTFQALRIFVNEELTELEAALPEALRILAPGGVCAVVSFHSLEDRIVKQCFKAAAQEHRVALATKKPMVPSRAELHENPRARSAKLRAVIKNL